VGVGCGIMIVIYDYVNPGRESTLGSKIYLFAEVYIYLYIIMILQTIIHEAGHLLFGLLAGYSFSSFRVGGFMWIKDGNGLKFKKFARTVIGGQCLMIPPQMSDNKIPLVLYNMGGPFANVLSSLVFVALYYIFKDVSYHSVILLMISIVGFGMALINGIPMRMKTLDNDGYNTLTLVTNKAAMRSFYFQMKITQQYANGIRLQDMPLEWFELPKSDDMNNGITAAMGCFACNRLMDHHSFEEAAKLIDQLFEMDCAFTGLHRKLLICNRIYLELISDKKQELLNTLMDDEQIKFMKSMKKSPAVLRTVYTYELLYNQDIELAANIKELFEKCASTYPYPIDIEIERELISITDSMVTAYEPARFTGANMSRLD
jgi:hypothetical protein